VQRPGGDGAAISAGPGEWLSSLDAESLTGSTHQREFVRWWKEAVRGHGGDRKSSAQIVALEMDDAESLTGSTHQQMAQIAAIWCGARWWSESVTNAQTGAFAEVEDVSFQLGRQGMLSRRRHGDAASIRKAQRHG
jgi:hypothetical protein